MREQMHVRIVPMTGDHLDEVAGLERICFTTPWSRNMLVEELQNDCAAFLVAMDDEDHVAGYAGLLVVLDEENNPVACEKQAAQVLRDGVVVDYINVLFMHFAIFNFADICVCVGVGLLMLVVLLDSFKKEETAKQKADDDGAA